ncbi:NAD(P)H-dependent glycerol-3-phosphate dehydrogenase [Sphingomonas sp. ID0503]|uniref:NAD(P)H-dependent glycerol-3-phosphate dehydrogenase n=1 Tax=Sphingomonas sp. ID0503 TaxID=3399691 RepID=UPI003AFB22FD
MSTAALIIGYGAFGRALYHALRAKASLSVAVYLRTPTAEMDCRDADAIYHDLPAIPVGRFSHVLVAVPSYAVRSTVGALALRRDGSDPVFISCAKGIDLESGQFPSEMLADLTGSDRIGALSGPSFTDEMVAGKRTLVSVATPDLGMAKDVARQLSTDNFRLRPTDDVHGLELLSVAKNIIALGAGLIDGLKLGENFRAAFVAQGVFELADLLPRLGGNADTLHSIGGLGDILLTCVSARSRNYRMGLAIGSGESAAGIMSEGLNSATSFVRYLERKGVYSTYFESVADAIDAPAGIINILNNHAA